MTKSQLLDENKRLRKALLQIVFETSKEGMEKRKQKRIQEGCYCNGDEMVVSIARANTVAMHGLYGDAYLLGDIDECVAKARKEMEEYESS